MPGDAWRSAGQHAHRTTEHVTRRSSWSSDAVSKLQLRRPAVFRFTNWRSVQERQRYRYDPRGFLRLLFTDNDTRASGVNSPHGCPAGRSITIRDTTDALASSFVRY